MQIHLVKSQTQMGFLRISSFPARKQKGALLLYSLQKKDF
jgi:hypothetical protein